MAKKNNVADENKFTKEQLYSSKKYEMKKDIIAIVLKDNELYTTDEADKAIKEFLDKEVE
jgi:hypothetical protein